MSIFFGAATGRCGTMTLANLLNAETKVTCLHEGKIRRGTNPEEQWLPFLTLQNVVAYHNPEKALEIIQETRAQQMPSLLDKYNLKALGDIAYNYPPFLKVLPQVFPHAQLIVIFRDGRDFVRSAYTSEVPDPTPVGWLDEDRPMTKLERYIALGRLRPAETDIRYGQWQRMTPVEKNAWLWAETNRLILESLDHWNQEHVFTVRFEEFFSNPVFEYENLRRFLNITAPCPDSIPALLKKPINARHQFKLPRWQEWDQQTMDSFLHHAGDMMARLGYT